MILCDNQSSRVIQINKTLIEKKHACFDSNWQSLAIKLVSFPIPKRNTSGLLLIDESGFCSYIIM